MGRADKINWCEGMEWIESGLGQVADCCDHGNELQGSIKCLEFLD
jgi:hypothetical protein